jgi:hypothetical protein
MPAHIQWLGVSNWWPEDRMCPNSFAAAACKSFSKQTIILAQRLLFINSNVQFDNIKKSVAITVFFIALSYATSLTSLCFQELFNFFMYSAW